MAGNTYYVDSAYGGGGLGDLGSATNPFTTIQDAIDAAAHSLRCTRLVPLK